MTVYALDDREPVLPSDGEYWIAPTAVVVGDVVVKRNASLWWGVAARGDMETITVGEDSNVQEGSVLHADSGVPTTIGDRVTVGHKAMLHGCTVGDDSLIGIGAIVLNRAVIGRNCLVGAGALITEGKVFEDGWMILGSPAKAVRRLTEGEIAGIGWSARHYVENWKRARRGLREVG